MVDHMIMGGKIAMLGIPAGKLPVDWNTDDLQVADHQGHLRARDVRDLAQDDRHAAIGLDVRKVITHRMKAADFAQGFALMKQGSCGKVVLDWST